LESASNDRGRDRGPHPGTGGGEGFVTKREENDQDDQQSKYEGVGERRTEG